MMTSDPLQSDLTHPLSWIISVAQHLDDTSAVSNDFRTELDSHAASIVAGRNVHVLRDSGRTVDVGPFTESLGKLKRIPVVDCAIAHDCPYSGTTRVMILYNALHIKEMNHNLLPPFVVRRKGNILNDIPKMQVQDPSVEDHSIFFPNDDVRIPLQLIDTISYFSLRKPTHDELT